MGFYNATFGHIKCYGQSASFDPLDFPASEHDGISLTNDECVECDEQCTECKYGHAQIRPGYAVSMTKYENKRPLYQMTGNRAVFACPVPEACNVTYASGTYNPDNGLGGEGWNQCGIGYTGPLCAVCAQGFSRKGLHGTCSACDSGSSVNTLAMIVLILVGFCGFLTGAYFLVVADSQPQGDGEESSGLASAVKQIFAISKILIGLYQIIAQMEVSMDIPYPESFQWFVVVIRGLSFDFLSMINVGCISTLTFYNKFFFATGLPVLMGLGCLAVFQILKSGKDEQGITRARNIVVQMVFFILFLIYPFVSQTVFSGFNCRQLGDYEAWLGADYQISCDTLAHVLYLAVAILAVGLYPVGIPLGTLFLLIRSRKEMAVENSPARLRYSFLVSDYKPEYYYWETLEMLRKVILTGLLIFLARGSILQLVVGILITFVFLLATARNMPYESMTSNRFKLATESALLLTLIFAILLKVDLSKEDIDEFSVGMIMLANNTLIPAMTLFMALVGHLSTVTDAVKETGEALRDGKYDLSIENPLRGSIASDVEHED
eukprot:SAG11_NODE_118_length_15921_cov_30.283448_3_plen_550_part_00